MRRAPHLNGLVFQYSEIALWITCYNYIVLMSLGQILNYLLIKIKGVAMNDLEKLPKIKSKEFALEKIININHKPHPYCITQAHLTASVCSVYLTSESIEQAERLGLAKCGMFVRGDQYTNKKKKGFVSCDVGYADHISDRVLFVRALVDKKVSDLTGINKYLNKIKPKLLELKIDGVAFLSYKPTLVE